MMDDVLFFYFISHILIGFTTFVLGTFIVYRDRRKVNVVFFLFLLAISLWAFSYAVWIASFDYGRALFFACTLNIFALFIPPLYLHWLLLYFNRCRPFKVVIPYMVSIIIAFFGYSSLYIAGVEERNIFTHFPVSGPLHYVFLVEWFAIVAYGIVRLIIEYNKEQDPQKKKQILCIFIGLLVGFAAGSINFLLMVGIDIISPFVSSLVLVFPVMIGYAMLKYNLMNVRVISTQILLLILNVMSFALFLTATSKAEYIFKGFFSALVLIVSYLLIKNYNQETTRKEELIRLSNELKRANMELTRLDKSKSEFISIASHQLRTPLTAIKGYISLILEGVYGDNLEKRNDALNKIFLANERLIQLVEDLLNITHIESGKMDFHFEKIHIEEIIDELYDMFIIRAKEKGLDLQKDLPHIPVPAIHSDRSKLREVISNLMDNAIKYTQKGFVRISVAQEEQYVRIVVADSGMGISEESMKTLFRKFSRGTDSTKVYTEGTGLGLYVGRNLIESQGGRIYARSEGVGKGSEFIIEMPIHNNK